MLHAGAAAAATGGSFAEPIALPDGSVSAPAAGFGSDGATGFYRPGAKQVGIAVNGVPGLFAQRSGTADADLNLVFGGVTPRIDAGLNTYAYQATATGLRLTFLASDGASQQMWLTTAASYCTWVVAGARTLYLQVASGGANALEVDQYGLAKLGQNGATGGVLLAMKTRTAAPTTSDVAAGYAQLVKNSTDNSVKLFVNDGGVMKSVTLS